MNAVTPDKGIAWVVGVGASRGLGAASAKRFAREGFTVAVTGRSADAIGKIVDEIAAAGGHAIAAVGDAQDEAGMIAILDRLEATGPVEVGIYNAGNAIWGPPLETKVADFEAVWRVGCLGGFIFGREVARRMLPRQRGTIIFSGASAALRGKAAFAAFSATKAGLRMLSQSFAREFGPQGIHVAHAIIDGSIEGDKIFGVIPDIGQRKGPDGLLHPDAIADGYWYLHRQHRSSWTQELDFRPYAETF
ncbi:MAG: NADP-dependent 3-hydroxy acid dehydrogenase YdfG [Rhodospirillales bacterium]|jgi:NAD(P)-dependent dehydrogenase (short-subunit alcohol dehydrogenase family)|nr:NADP-dependent 3-hydroxy acid dehydrogenase YdfG [Rhodospirillales bacterium]